MNTTAKTSPSTPLLIGFVTVLTAVIAGSFGYYIGSMPKNVVIPSQPPIEGVACTMDARVCPDGSSVGRTGPSCEFEECPQAGKVSTQTYTGKHNPFDLSYPALYTIETTEIKQNNSVIEQVVFKGQNTDVDFAIRVVKGVKTLPEFLYDEAPTGTYEIDGVQGVYLELPQGYGDGGDWKPLPTTIIVFVKDSTKYELAFYGASDITNINIQQIMNGFSFTANDL